MNDNSKMFLNCVMSSLIVDEVVMASNKERVNTKGLFLIVREGLLHDS